MSESRRGMVAPLVALALLVGAAVAGPLLWPVNPVTLDLANIGAAPSAGHPLGTDEAGRDVLSRLLNGGRVTLTVGLFSMVVAIGLGSTIGGIAGYRGGAWEAVLMRLTDSALAIPSIFVSICLLTFLGSSIPVLILAIGGTTWMASARIVRGEVARVRTQPFVEAAHALGVRHPGVVLRHVAPHVLPVLLVSATLGVATAVLTESALSYLGIGVQPPVPSWGNMLSAAQSSLSTYPWLSVAPGAMIFAIVATINALGEALARRD